MFNTWKRSKLTQLITRDQKKTASYRVSIIATSSSMLFVCLSKSVFPYLYYILRTLCQFLIISYVFFWIFRAVGHVVAVWKNCPFYNQTLFNQIKLFAWTILVCNIRKHGSYSKSLNFTILFLFFPGYSSFLTFQLTFLLL